MFGGQRCDPDVLWTPRIPDLIRPLARRLHMLRYRLCKRNIQYGTLDLGLCAGRIKVGPLLDGASQTLMK